MPSSTDPAPDAYEKLVDRLLASPALRRAVGAALARRRPLRRDARLRQGPAPAQRLAVPRLRHPRVQRRQAVRAGSCRSRSPATCCSPARWTASTALGLHRRRARGTSSATPRCPRRRSTARSPATSTATTWWPTRSNTFVGLTVQCAQCHNHKFDPIAQEDYYRLQAVFAAIDRADRPYDTDPATAAKHARTEAAKRTRAANAQDGSTPRPARPRPAPALAELDRQIAEAGEPAAATPRRVRLPQRPRPRSRTRRSGCRSISAQRRRSTAVVLRRCHDDFNGIGAGFGFPVRFKVEVSDDPTFQAGVTLVADRTGRGRAQPRHRRRSRSRPGGEAGRYVRVTATKLAPRQNDYIFALAELRGVRRRREEPRRRARP